MYKELLNCGLQEWYTSDYQQEGINVTAKFETFEEAFRVLVKGSASKHVQFQHQWYSNWSWIESESSDGAFFSEILEKLNDDCIRDTIKYIDLLHLIYIAHINDRFKALVAEKLSKLHIFPFTVGSIKLMNFRYLIEMFSSSITEISISLNAFASTLGFYFTHIKRHVLQIIYNCTGDRLKTLYLYDFNLTESEMRNFDYIFRLFSKKNIELKFKSY